MKRGIGHGLIVIGCLMCGVAGASEPREDPGKKACVPEARRLCPAEMKSFSRKKVETCMIARIDQTSPACHAAMLQIKTQREAGEKH